MPEGLTEITAEDVPCRDPDCQGTGELETDGDLAYYVCDTCGFEYGYKKTDAPLELVCQMGVPETVRRMLDPIGSQTFDPQIGQPSEPVAVPVTLGKKR